VPLGPVAAGLDVPILVKCEHLNHGGSVKDSFAMVGRLLREEGLLVGGSAGTAVAAAVRVARAGGLDGPVVTVLPASWDRYLSTAWLRSL
jgi:cysteine synthase